MTFRGMGGANFSSFCLPRSVGFVVIGGACLVLFGPLRAESWHLAGLTAAVVLAVVNVSKPWARIALSGLLAAAITLLVCQDRLAQRWPASADGERVIARVQVDSLIVREGGSLEFDARVDIESPVPLARSLRARIRWNEAGNILQSGDTWRLMLRMARPRPARNPGGFDSAREALRDRFDATATVVSSWSGNERLSRGGSWLLRTRARLADDIRAQVVDRDAAALFAGLAVGATGAISREQWQVFSITGTTHLVAISGLHVTLFAWLAAGFARWLWRHCKPLVSGVERERFAAAVGVTAALGYALLAGFEVPTQRTVVMLAVWWLLRLSGREQRGFEVLSLAMLAVWLFDPLAPLAAGFWLSFIAMGTLLLGDLIRAQGSPEVTGWLGSVWSGLRVQWRVSLALVPATLAWFSSVSISGVAVNLAAIPIFSFVLVPLVLAATTLQTLSAELARHVWHLTEWIYLTIWPTMLWVAEQPFASWKVMLPWPSLVALTLLVPLWLLPVPWRWRVASAVLLLPAALPSWWSGVSIPSGQARIWVLDGGDGAALLVFTHRHTLVYDTAEVFGSAGRRAESLVLPALLAAHRSHIDTLVLSRSHGLRAAGVGVLLARTTVGRVTAGGQWPGAPEVVESCASPRRWQWDQVQFRTFAAAGPDRSCMLHVSVTDGPSLLVPERLDAQEARALLEDAAQAAALTANVVLAPRRGSPTAVTASFVSAVAPRWVVVSAREHGARRERQLVERWALPPDRILSTATAGMIEIELAPRAPARVKAVGAMGARRIWQGDGPR